LTERADTEQVALPRNEPDVAPEQGNVQGRPQLVCTLDAHIDAQAASPVVLSSGHRRARRREAIGRGQQRCDDCNTFGRRLGEGGHCPACSEIITIKELLDMQ